MRATLELLCINVHTTWLTLLQEFRSSGIMSTPWSKVNDFIHRPQCWNNQVTVVRLWHVNCQRRKRSDDPLSSHCDVLISGPQLPVSAPCLRNGIMTRLNGSFLVSPNKGRTLGVFLSTIPVQMGKEIHPSCEKAKRAAYYNEGTLQNQLWSPCTLSAPLVHANSYVSSHVVCSHLPGLLRLHSGHVLHWWLEYHRPLYRPALGSVLLLNWISV